MLTNLQNNRIEGNLTGGYPKSHARTAKGRGEIPQSAIGWEGKDIGLPITAFLIKEGGKKKGESLETLRKLNDNFMSK